MSKVDAQVAFITKLVNASITRPANATQYAAGDVIAAADDSHFVFEKALRRGPFSGSINTARLFSSQNGSPAMDVELWLFSQDITEVGDNAAFAPSDAELLTCIGIIDFAQANWRIANPASGASGNAMCEASNLGMTIRGGGETVYGVLVERATYTPVSGEVITAQLVVTQD